MSEATETVTADETAVVDEQAGQVEATAPKARERSDEAKRYRLRLRDTEAERDRLVERVARFETAEAERVARAEGAAVPGDVLGLLRLDELRDDDGELDRDLVRDGVRDVLRERPTWRSPAPDLGGGVRATADAQPVGFSAAFGNG